MKEELLRLAERCEKATGPEFAIDCEIEALVFDNHQGMMRSFTRSLDAAMTLVPEGWQWMIVTDDIAAVYRRPKSGGGYSRIFDSDCRDKPPALALCAAALKARASVKEQNNGG